MTFVSIYIPNTSSTPTKVNSFQKRLTDKHTPGRLFRCSLVPVNLTLSVASELSSLSDYMSNLSLDFKAKKEKIKRLGMYIYH